MVRWYNFWCMHCIYICWHFVTNGVKAVRRCCIIRLGLFLDRYWAASIATSWRTNGLTIELTAQTQNWWRYCVPRNIRHYNLIFNLENIYFLPKFLDILNNHFTSSPYGGFRAYFAWGLSSCTRLARVSKANMPTLYAVNK